MPKTHIGVSGKAASALAAKIHFPAAQHVARTFYPRVSA